MSINISFPGNWSVISLKVIATPSIWIVCLLAWGNFFRWFCFASPAFFFFCFELVKRTHHSDSRRRLMFSFSLWFGGHSLILWVFIRQVDKKRQKTNRKCVSKTSSSSGVILIVSCFSTFRILDLCWQRTISYWNSAPVRLDTSFAWYQSFLMEY